jgi:hypothetical protein
MFSQMCEEQNIHKHTQKLVIYLDDPNSHVKTRSRGAEGEIQVALVLHPSCFPQKQSVNQKGVNKM